MLISGARVQGTVTVSPGGVTAHTAGFTIGSNLVSGNVTANDNAVGTGAIKANNIVKALFCAGNDPPPVNAGQPNTAVTRSGECAPL